jgi:hypothetical protein
MEATTVPRYLVASVLLLEPSTSGPETRGERRLTAAVEGLERAG